MKNKLLVVSSSPHVRAEESTEKLMMNVIVALIPAIVGAWVFFGKPALIIMAVSIVAALSTEFVMLKIRGKSPTPADINSAIVTGILVAFCVTPRLPWWIAAIASFFGIAIAKHCFGGLGFNIFNPALAGRIFVMAAYPLAMTKWAPTYFQQLDGITGATPLAILKENLAEPLPGYWELFIGNVGGCIGEISALLLLIGAAYLLYKKTISFHIPLSFLGSLALFMWIFGGKTMVEGGTAIRFFHGDPLFHILAGGAVLGAFFMATDLVTSPMTPKGMWIFGCGCGIITGIIRIWGGYPEGVSYAIFLMNMSVPIIDRFTKPAIFGADFVK